MYWHIGQRIFLEEQEGKDRADYGKFLVKHIADSLEPEFGVGYSRRQIELFRQFYRMFPIVNAVRSQLSWTHYRFLIRLDSQNKIEFYIALKLETELEVPTEFWLGLQMDYDLQVERNKLKQIA